MMTDGSGEEGRMPVEMMVVKGVEVKVGVTRIRDGDGFVGTVVYLGPVASAKDEREVYAGVVWDDGTRGKHDGSVICRRTNRLVRHFSSPTATGGSFLRLPKLDVGVALDQDLMRTRYVPTDAPLVAPHNILPHVARTVRGHDKPIELLGELQIRGRQQLGEIDDIMLRSLGIARPSSQPDAMRPYQHLKEVDLAGNLLCDWNHVLTILRQFPNLTNFSVSANRIGDIDPHNNILHTMHPNEFPKMTVLNLNDCHIGSFQTVYRIAEAMPNLEQLCVAHSDLSDMPDYFDSQRLLLSSSGSALFQHLTLLDCSDCHLSSWAGQVQCLGSLPSLTTLILNENPITDVESSTHTTADNANVTWFPSLDWLHLSTTSIQSWSSFRHLASLPVLTSLHVRNIPLTSPIGTGEARALVIARLPQLESLNNSRITPKERVEAERRYVSHVARELWHLTNHAAADPDTETAAAKQQAKQDLLMEDNPQFQELMERHKDSMMASSLGMSGSTSGGGNLASDAVNITIRSMAASSCTMEPLRKRLPGSLKVGRLKAMCSRAFHLDIDLQILYFKTSSDPFPTELDDDENTLSYYGVNDGAEILMNEVDLDANQREAARSNKAHEQRILEQEQKASAIQELQKKGLRDHSMAAEQASSRI